MSRNRLMLLLAAVAALAVVAGGFFLGVQPQLARVATANEESRSIASSNEATRTEIARLREQAKGLPKMRAELAALRSSVPSSAAVSAFIGQLNTTAEGSGVKVATITVGDAAAYTPPVEATPAAGTAATGAATATPTPTPSATAAVPQAPKTTTDSSITAENFSVIPVSVSVNGEFAQALSFVKGVQSSPRLFLIDSISSSIASANSTGSADSADGGDSPSWTFSGSIYVLAEPASKG